MSILIVCTLISGTNHFVPEDLLVRGAHLTELLGNKSTCYMMWSETSLQSITPLIPAKQVSKV